VHTSLGKVYTSLGKVHTSLGKVHTSLGKVHIKLGKGFRHDLHWQLKMVNSGKGYLLLKSMMGITREIIICKTL